MICSNCESEAGLIELPARTGYGILWCEDCGSLKLSEPTGFRLDLDARSAGGSGYLGDAHGSDVGLFLLSRLDSES